MTSDASPWHCPECGSTEVDRVDVAGTPTESFIKLKCSSCGYEAWENEELAVVYWGTEEEKAAARRRLTKAAETAAQAPAAPTKETKKKETTTARPTRRKRRARPSADEVTERQVACIPDSELRCPKCGGADVDTSGRISRQSGNSDDYIVFACRTCGHRDLFDGDDNQSSCGWVRTKG